MGRGLAVTAAGAQPRRPGTYHSTAYRRPELFQIFYLGLAWKMLARAPALAHKEMRDAPQRRLGAWVTLA